MALNLDALGRLPREYRQVIHPFEEFSDRKFKQRYRISKEGANFIVEDMIVEVPAQGQERGGGLSIHDKVGTCSLNMFVLNYKK